MAAAAPARARRGFDASAQSVCEAIQTALSLRLPALRLAQGHARHEPRTFVYLFAWTSPAEGRELGACHALDLLFTFGTLDAPGMVELGGAGPEAERLAANVMDAWLAFARAGDPSHPGIGRWPAWGPVHQHTLVFASESGSTPAPLEEEHAAWDRAGGAA